MSDRAPKEPPTLPIISASERQNRDGDRGRELVHGIDPKFPVVNDDRSGQASSSFGTEVAANVVADGNLQAELLALMIEGARTVVARWLSDVTAASTSSAIVEELSALLHFAACEDVEDETPADDPKFSDATSGLLDSFRTDLHRYLTGKYDEEELERATYAICDVLLRAWLGAVQRTVRRTPLLLGLQLEPLDALPDESLRRQWRDVTRSLDRFGLGDPHAEAILVTFREVLVRRGKRPVQFPGGVFLLIEQGDATEILRVESTPGGLRTPTQGHAEVLDDRTPRDRQMREHGKRSDGKKPTPEP